MNTLMFCLGLMLSLIGLVVSVAMYPKLELRRSKSGSVYDSSTYLNSKVSLLEVIVNTAMSSFIIGVVLILLSMFI